MADTQMIPFTTGENTGWDAGVGGAIGAWLGSWFANGWGGNGYGPGRGGAGVVAAVDGAAAGSVIMDSLTNISSQLNGVNTTLLNSQAAQNQALCQGFSGINSSIYQTAAQDQQTMCQGFNGLNNTVQNTSSQARFDTMNGFNQLGTALANCCCTTQNAIATGFGNLALENCQNTGQIVNAISNEGSATRALINQNYINDLETKLCDAKSKIGSLETQNYVQGVIGAQSTIFDQKLASAVNTIITHVHAAAPAAA